jgi:hypothetical protein
MVRSGWIHAVRKQLIYWKVSASIQRAIEKESRTGILIFARGIVFLIQTLTSPMGSNQNLHCLSIFPRPRQMPGVSYLDILITSLLKCSVMKSSPR